jgi:CRISPR-associated protein Cas1
VNLLNTLYVTVPESYLRLDNDTVRLLVGDETRLRVPLHHLGAIVCFGHVGISAPLMHRLAESGIGLVLLDNNGRFKARLEGETQGNVLLRREQHLRAMDPEFPTRLAARIVAGKLRNQRYVLLRGGRDSKSADERNRLARVAQSLAASLRALRGAENLDSIRGIEGEAARSYFDALNLLIRPDRRDRFQMQGRTRRPPRDPVNALLSFLYAMWMNDCRSACEATGLDPQVGFLHALRPGRAALALDLMEEFRPFADRLVLTLINRDQVGTGDFEDREGGAVLLAGDARRNVVVAFQERKQETLRHELLTDAIPLGLVPHVQARLLARHVRGEVDDYPPFRMR